MSPNPVVILHTDNPEAATKVLSRHHPDLEIHGCDTFDGLESLITETGAEVVYSVRFSSAGPFPRETLLNAASVKWISVGGSGTDHLIPWNTDAVTVTNSAGVAADMMAQYALGAMLHFSLNFPEFRAAQKRHEWLQGTVEPIDGKTVLIVGLGQTGQAVAARCKTMGMQTVGVRARPKDTPNVDQVHGIKDLPRLCKDADYIVVCVPLLDSTRGLLGSDAFANMLPKAVVIDVSRGHVIDEDALLSALDNGQIRGAALDVFTAEPLPSNHALWGYDNVIITPHCSSVYDGWDLKSVEMFAHNLTRYRSGQALTNIVDPSLGY